MDRNAPRDRILSAMSNANRALVQPHLAAMPLKLRLLLQSSNRSIRKVHCPERRAASVMAIGGGERRQAEVAVVGREGVTRLPVVPGVDKSPCDAFMRIEGQVEGNSPCIDPAKLHEAKIKASPRGDYGLVEMARSSVISMGRDRLEECANGFDGVPEAENERLFGCAGTGDACVASSTS